MDNVAHYIVPADILDASCPGSPCHAHGIPADLTLRLLSVNWNDLAARDAFEALPGVLSLGEDWEPVPDPAVPLLASFQELAVSSDTIASGSTPTTVETPPAQDTVAKALRKTGWPGARLF